MNIFTLSLFLLKCSYHLEKSWGQDFPTLSYVMSPRENQGDTRRRRPHTRFKETISLKPPPPDWPSPTLGAADFLFDEPEVTSLSPLQAYQAKLQEEYLRDLEEQSLKRQIHTPQNLKHETSVWSSSDEDFKKLLDPNELLKLNKKLAPILTQNRKMSVHLQKGLLSTEERSANGFSTTKPKIKKETFAKGHQPNDQKMPLDNTKSPLSEQKARVKKKLKGKKVMESESRDGNMKTKRRKKKVRKFAFDVHRSGEKLSKVSLMADHTLGSQKLRVHESESKNSSSSESSVISKEDSLVIPKDEVYTFVKETKSTTRRSTSQEVYLSTTKMPRIATTTANISVGSTATTLTTPHITTTTKGLREKSTYSRRKMEVRDKRKQIKNEMEKVLKEEQLEGSFGDEDVEWTTSERPKIPLDSVTRHAVMLGILKQKIVNFMDNILKSKAR